MERLLPVETQSSAGSVWNGVGYVGGGLSAWGSAAMAFAVALAPETGGVSLAVAGLALSLVGDGLVSYGIAQMGMK
ncbi:hypothetical protein [Alicyclobacillus acidocaldarius]|uniref:hypothetical protein n=1 Tax=Alicyclobacillus acidocaldarius TaxID=405212 RepID=UPI00019DD121|nr:hypothetical protein [Alicyclobacillus acidocaldarius]